MQLFQYLPGILFEPLGLLGFVSLGIYSIPDTISMSLFDKKGQSSFTVLLGYSGYLMKTDLYCLDKMEALLLEQNKIVHEHSRCLLNLVVKTFYNAETI